MNIEVCRLARRFVLLYTGSISIIDTPIMTTCILMRIESLGFYHERNSFFFFGGRRPERISAFGGFPNAVRDFFKVLGPSAARPLRTQSGRHGTASQGYIQTPPPWPFTGEPGNGPNGPQGCASSAP